jgi:hypothetical protein
MSAAAGMGHVSPNAALVVDDKTASFDATTQPDLSARPNRRRRRPRGLDPRPVRSSVQRPSSTPRYRRAKRPATDLDPVSAEAGNVRVRGTGLRQGWPGLALGRAGQSLGVDLPMRTWLPFGSVRVNSRIPHG